MKALIQKEIIRKPISRGEDIKGRMESEATIIRIFGLSLYSKTVSLSSQRQ